MPMPQYLHFVQNSFEVAPLTVECFSLTHFVQVVDPSVSLYVQAAQLTLNIAPAVDIHVSFGQTEQ